MNTNYLSPINIEPEPLTEAVSHGMHDLRTPLAAIKAAASLLHNAPEQLDQEMRQELAEILDQEAERLGRLLTKFFLLTRGQTGILKLKPISCSVDELIKDAIDWLGSARHQYQLQSTLADDLPNLQADPELLAAAIGLVLENATNFAPTGSTIELRVWQQSTNLLITISDQGMGVPTNAVEQIFTPGYRRPDNGRRAGTGHGTGLSLALARNIIEAHDGILSVLSVGDAVNEVVSGLTMQISLPISQAVAHKSSLRTKRSPRSKK